MLRKRREKVAMKEALDFLLQLPWFDPETAPMGEVKSFAEALNKATNMTVQQKMMVAMVAAAVSGNVRAAEFIRDTIGQTIFAGQDGRPIDRIRGRRLYGGHQSERRRCLG